VIFKDQNKAIEIAKEIKLVAVDCDGTLTNGCTYYSNKGEELKLFSHIDGRGFALLKQNQIKYGIITSENSDIVVRRSEKINADFCILKSIDKVKSIITLMKKYDLKPKNIAYVGDDTNDLAVFKFLELTFAVKNAHEKIKNISFVQCDSYGGSGAVREAIDFILASKGLEES
jgi:3-deoxy-D-manno-octulosonate 8-phosphate phosphatase (KDO 8-P phosphatase)